MFEQAYGRVELCKLAFGLLAQFSDPRGLRGIVLNESEEEVEQVDVR